MTLDNLVGKTLDTIVPERADIQRLLEVCASSLVDAGIAALSAESRFDLAYKAIMQTANAALQANGYRTRSSVPGHHQTMVQSLTRTVGLDARTMVLLDGLRKQRNVIDYSGDMVSAEMAATALAEATTLLQRVQEWLRENKPDLCE
jgi:uncharacterized protein (UPF0332 family)